MPTSVVYAPTPRSYTLNPIGIWGHRTLAQHLHSVATPEDSANTMELGSPRTPSNIPKWFSPWLQPSMGYQRQYTATLFDPLDEIVVPTRKDNHFSCPKERMVIASPPTSQAETPAQSLLFESTKENSFESATARRPDQLNILPFVSPLVNDSRIPSRALDKDEDDDWVNFSKYKKPVGSEFINIGTTKFRVSTPPGSGSRLAKILKGREGWSRMRAARNGCSAHFGDQGTLTCWGNPSLLSVS